MRKKIVVVIALALFFRLFVLESVGVSGTAMVPALFPGDTVFVYKLYYGLRMPGAGSLLLEWRKPKAGDLVVLSNLGLPAVVLLRRVVAEPGESLRIKEGRVQLLRKGKWRALSCEATSLPSSYCWETASGKKFLTRTNESLEQSTVYLKKGEYFVLSDDRRKKPDSRDFGVIKSQNIVGKVTRMALPSLDKVSLEKALEEQRKERRIFSKIQ